MVKRISKILASRIPPILGPKKSIEISSPPPIPPTASPEKPVEVSSPPPVPPTLGPENPIELLKKQKADGEGLLKKDFLSLGEVTKWNLVTKDKLTKVFGPDSRHVDSVLNAGEHQVYSMYEPESLLERHRRKNFQASLRMLEIFMEEFESNKDSSMPDIIKKIENKVASERQRAAIAHRQGEGKKELELSKEPSEPDVSKNVASKEAAKNGKGATVRGQDGGKRAVEFSKESPKSDINKKIESTAALESEKVSTGQVQDEGKKELDLCNELSKPDGTKEIESPVASAASASPKVSLVHDPDVEEKELESNKEESKTDEREEIESGETSESLEVSIVRGPDEEKNEIELSKEPLKPNINKRIEKMETSESRRVFIVHGHEEEKKEVVVKFLEKLDLEPVILHEQPSHGVTLIEKFENYSDVVFAVIVLTGDDYGYPKGKPEESKPRPRQNVVFELGFLMGRFQGQRVCALHEEGLELPSDYRGLVFIPYDAGGIWKLLIARAMKTANIEVDLNKAV